MQTKKTIAIIGATGEVGSDISKRFSKGDYRLLLCSRHHGKALSLIEEIRSKTPSADVDVINCYVDTNWEADIFIVAVPSEAEKEVAEKIKEVANNKIVICVVDPLFTYNGLVTDLGTSSTDEMKKLLPNSKVIKAFTPLSRKLSQQAMLN
jgi:8-hydroxy-5-deazaflavin:NADPH oxidoreductase